MPQYSYQLGGSLAIDAPSYVHRLADSQLYEALKRGEFCYVLNSRQMGKSSLLVQTKHRLQQDGFHCAAVDLSVVGSEQITPLQWYKGFVADLCLQLGLLKTLNLKTWWQERNDLGLLQRLRWFIEELLLVQFPQQQLFIFVDEIDSLLGLNFAIDDFFALIRFCYNQRAINPEYQRITFAIFGVATPSDLVRDRTKTPFNIGQAIELKGFEWEEVTPLIQGLEKTVDVPASVVKAILNWTGGQPFLTQKLCHLVVHLSQGTIGHDGNGCIPPGTESFWIENLVKTRIISRWESQDEPEHLRTIRDRIERNGQRAGRILGIYQQILQGIEIKSDDSREQIELLLSGLVVRHEGILKVKNRIYQQVFNLQWVEKRLAALRPYSQAFDAWVASGQKDQSRLLRGQALKDAQVWAQGKSLSDLDYLFFNASQEIDRKEVELRLEAERVKEVEARLVQEQKAVRIQQFLLNANMAALQQSRLSEIKAIASASEALYASHQGLEALVQAIKAKQKLQQLGFVQPELEQKIDNALRQAVYGTTECNHLTGHTADIWSVDISPDSNLIVSAGMDGAIKLWQRDGTLLQTLQNESVAVWSVKFSPDGQMIVSGHNDGNVKLWRLDETTPKIIANYSTTTRGVNFNLDGQIVASGHDNGMVNLWSLDGVLLGSFKHPNQAANIIFVPDSQLIITEAENVIYLWHQDGTLHKKWVAHQAGISALVLSPNGKVLASTSQDTTTKLWHLDGTLLTTLVGHSAAVWDIAFSPDGKTLVTVSGDKTVKIWSVEGIELSTLKAHRSTVRTIAYSTEGSYFISAGADRIIRMWKPTHDLKTTINAHSAPIFGVAISPDSSTIATASLDYTVKLWQRDGTLLNTLQHEASMFSVAFSPVGASLPSGIGEMLATGSNDSIVRLWQRGGRTWDKAELLKILPAEGGLAFSLTFSLDGKLIASGYGDGKVRLWTTDGTLHNTLIGQEEMVSCVAFSPDSQLLASSGNLNQIKVWHRDGRLLTTLAENDASVNDVAFSPDGQLLASCSGDSTIKLWKYNSKDGVASQSTQTFVGHNGVVSKIAWSSDGQFFASCGMDTTVKIWSREGELITTLLGHSGSVWNLAIAPSAAAEPIAPDGSFLASVGEDNTLVVWNLPRILKLDLLEYGCNWVRDYLRTNAEVEEGMKL
jgi:WD40 repeat protein